ncbi:MAG: hypothetical protein KKB31_06275 [Nanoarchaeota archaeon]|nr:hypothetical protein [Nanoarchaeota archaeon]
MSPTRKTLKKTTTRKAPSRRRLTPRDEYLIALKEIAQQKLLAIKKERRKQRWCEENKHPDARLGGEYAPDTFFYCAKCKVIFYDPTRPEYKAAIERGDIRDDNE